MNRAFYSLSPNSHPPVRLLACLLCALAFWLACTPSTSEPASEALPPNFLLIVADDLGYEKLGCYGGLGVETPELDRMAAQGTLFERAYASAVCTPSRMSLYTGQYAPHHGFLDVLPIHTGTREAVDFTQYPTYAQQLRAAGYQTSVTGKWQLATLEFHPDHVRQGGFDSWYVWQIWRDSAKTTRFWDPTYNHDGLVKELDRFGPDQLTDYVIQQMAAAKAAGKPFSIQHNMVLPHVPIVRTPLDTLLGQEASLDHMVTYLDMQVGKLLRALDSLELTQSTYVFFMGDNGTQATEPRLTTDGAVGGGKWELNEGGTHVPLIAYAPGRVPAGARVQDLVEITDFFPTLCELAGVTLADSLTLDGQSFVAPLAGAGAGPRQYVTASYVDDFCVFDGQWRLHHLEDRLWDCRELPMEQPADMASEEAQQAYERLMPELRKLRQGRAEKVAD